MLAKGTNECNINFGGDQKQKQLLVQDILKFEPELSDL